MFQSINPVNGQIIAEYSAHTPGEAEAIVMKTHQAWLHWKNTPFDHRATLLQRAASILRERKDDLSHMMVLEMGKPIKQALAETEKCATACLYYADHGAQFLAPEPIVTESNKSYIAYNPLGVVLAVMPWNFPLWQVFRFAAPALMAGNAALLKHASNVMGSAMAIEEIFREAGFPEDLFRTLRIAGSKVEPLIRNPLVKAVTLTGSVGAGSAVARVAGEEIKKTVLELGGSDPYLILEDADLEQAATICATSRMINNGQSCIAAKRFIVVEKVYEPFLELFTQKMKQKKMGDPLNINTELGPMAQVSLRDELHEQVTQSIDKGARCIIGGEIPEQPGAWYPATVLADVMPGMPAYHDELFGPVASVIKARDQQDAIDIANDSEFGLGAAVFTRDLAKGEQIAREQLNAGCCFVNDFVKSDPRLPFGGIGHSGYGRELSYLGIREFTNIKTVVVA